MAAIREAKRRGSDDAIFVSSDGVVLEAPTASLILRLGDVFVTPAPNGGILQGTTQLSAFAWLEGNGFETAYRDVAAAELSRADSAWLVSSVRLAAPITEIDGIPIALDSAFTARLNGYLLSPRD
ncbi:MAG: aminotransferase class IV, partial [Microbacterium sp.]